ncbi:MAG: hypothetical protein EOO54_26760, partial [Haliea sp.]
MTPQRQQQADIASDAPTQTGFTCTPLSGVMAAEIDGLDLARATPADMARIRELFLKHHLLVVRRQQLTDADIE